MVVSFYPRFVTETAQQTTEYKPYILRSCRLSFFLLFCHLKISLGASTRAAFRSKPSEKPLRCSFVRSSREKKMCIFVHFKEAFYYLSSVKGSSVKEI